MTELRMIVITCGKYVHSCDVWDSQGREYEYRAGMWRRVFWKISINISEEPAASMFRLEAPLLEAKGYSETLIPVYQNPRHYDSPDTNLDQKSPANAIYYRYRNMPVSEM